MPIYEYLCSECKRTIYLTAKEPPKELGGCPHCGSKKVFRAWNAPNVIFKGNGFYSTDNENKKKNKGKDEEK